MPPLVACNREAVCLPCEQVVLQLLYMLWLSGQPAAQSAEADVASTTQCSCQGQHLRSGRPDAFDELKLSSERLCCCQLLLLLSSRSTQPLLCVTAVS